MATGGRIEDRGYFGPSSVTWLIHGDRVAMTGGLRALLLQALHPGAMAKLAQVSDFANRPWRRLQRTVDYVMTVSFGTRAAADAASAHVREVHRAAGVGDPEQLAWVHAAFVDSMLAFARSAGLPLGRDGADRYVDEQARAARLVDVPADRVPHSVADLRALIAAMRPRLRALPQARAAAELVIAMPLPVRRRFALPARAGWTTLAAIAVGLLPTWARSSYGLPTLPGNDLATAVALRSLRAATGAVPARFRQGPAQRAARLRSATAAS